jgi:hypothetical protein
MLVDASRPLVVNDVFIHDVELPKRALIYPLGFPVELATNSEAVIAAARYCWGTSSLAYPETPLSVEIAVFDDDADRLPQQPFFRADRHIMSIVSDARNHAICDFGSGRAIGWLSQCVAENDDFLRVHFVEAPVLIMVGEAHLAPIHAAFVSRRGSGVILCGDTHAGKSTLAYSCARNGWDFVSDDGTFLVRNRRERSAVGNPRTIRLREDAKDLFPELRNHRVALRPNGNPGIEVQTSELPISTAGGSVVDHIVFLRRSNSGRARMNPFEGTEALAWFEQAASYGRASSRAAQREAYRRLLSANLWELYYSDLDEAVSALDRLEVYA